MKILDRYILRQLFATTLFALVAFVVIFITVDMMENLDDFLDSGVETAIIAEYYVYFMPEIIKLMIPVALLFAGMFTTGKLNNYSELTAMTASGMSLYRMLFPILLVAFLTSIGAIYFNGWIVPLANAKKFSIERKYLGKSLDEEATQNLFFQSGKYRICSIQRIDEDNFTAYNISINDFSPADPTKLIERLDAKTMTWNDTTKKWTMHNGIHRMMDDSLQKYWTFTDKTIRSISFSPEDVLKKQKKPDEMNYDEMNEFIANQESLGNEVARYKVDFYGKIAFPFAGVIVVLFGVPFSSIKRKSGLGVEFGIAVAVCFLYMVFLKVSQVFGYNGDLPPLLTAWMANIIFFVLAIVTILRVPK